MEQILNSAEEKMSQAIEALKKQFLTVRSGKASAGLVENVKVNYYNTPTPLNQVANITCPEARLIMISPWDKSIIGDVEKAILAANLGFTPQNDGTIIRIVVPELSGERRKELAKIVKSKSEEIKISIRNIRRDANEQLKKQKSQGISEDEIKSDLDKVQKMTDSYIQKVVDITAHKEKEIMTV
jgi:ribosome recycling factor